ncbi:MAG TPA: glycerate kinase [Actinomycetota bacterium]|nr:glycerate kinase [Actinomycetota bacterium]
MRVLVCPDKFRGTLTALQAAEAIERGWRRERPLDELEIVPLADGGEGTLDALVPDLADTDARRVRCTVRGPLGEPLGAEFGLRGRTGVVEMARASGLELLTTERRDPRRTTTRGTGELMLAALDAGVDRLLVCLGGSATNDGGVGMAAALGARFLDAEGRAIADGGAALMDLVRIDIGPMPATLRTVGVIGVTDVDNALCGPAGAAAMFAPQKGASPEDVVLLDRALAHLAAVTARDLGVDRSREPGAGAAGGLGFGLMAFAGARLRPGVEVVMEAVGFERRARAADLIITGEGSFDEQSLHGKVPAGVLGFAASAGVPVVIACGVASVAPEGVSVRSLVERVGAEAALGDARRSLELVAHELAHEYGRG